MNKITVSLVSLAMLATFIASAAPKFASAGVEAAAAYNGNYVLTLNASDFLLNTSSNVTVAFTNAMPAPVSIRLASWKLVKPFDSSINTNAYGITVSLGDTNNTTRWLTTTQVAKDQTPTVYGGFGPNTLNSTNVLDSQTVDVQVVTTVAITGNGALPSDLDRGSIQFFFEAVGKTE